MRPQPPIAQPIIIVQFSETGQSAALRGSEGLCISVWDLVDRLVGWLADLFGGLAGWVWSSATVLTRDNTGLVVIILLLGLLLFLMLRRRR